MATCLRFFTFIWLLATISDADDRLTVVTGQERLAGLREAVTLDEHAAIRNAVTSEEWRTLDSVIRNLESPKGTRGLHVGLVDVFKTDPKRSAVYLKLKLNRLSIEREPSRWIATASVLAAVDAKSSWAAIGPVLASSDPSSQKAKELLLGGIFPSYRGIDGFLEIMEPLLDERKVKQASYASTWLWINSAFVPRAIRDYLGRERFDCFLEEKLSDPAFENKLWLIAGTVDSEERFDRLVRYLMEPARSDFEIESLLKVILTLHYKYDSVGAMLRFLATPRGTSISNRWIAELASNIYHYDERLAGIVQRRWKAILSDPQCSHLQHNFVRRTLPLYLGKEALPTMREHILTKKSSPGYEVLSTMACLSEGTEDIGLADVIGAGLKANLSDPSWQYYGTAALLRLRGPSARAHLKQYFDAVDSPSKGSIDETALLWHHKGWSLNHVLKEFVNVGLLSKLPKDTRLREHFIIDENISRDFEVIEAFKDAQSLCYFDAEADEIPVQHDQLVKHFAENSRGAFQPSHVKQTVTPDGKEYLISFIVGNKGVEFRANLGGDWYDINAVHHAVNVGLMISGRRERFLSIDGMGQAVGYFFGDPVVMLPLCEKYGIYISENPTDYDARQKRRERATKRTLSLIDALLKS